MKDHELLQSTKTLVARELEITTEVLRHLAEIERRKLYADLKYPSLFEYAVRELGYSNATAQRQISSMRLMREMPEMEEKIRSGALNLTNVAQASSFFRDLKRAEPSRVVSREEKAAVLEKLEQKSTRECERILLAMSPPEMPPRERIRQIDLNHTELRFVVDAKLKAQLQRVRSLMGPRGGLLSLAELVSEMAALSEQLLEEKKFGKKRVQAEKITSGAGSEARPSEISSGLPRQGLQAKAGAGVQPRVTSGAGSASHTSNPDVGVRSQTHTSSAGSNLPAPKPNSRYIPQSVKHAVWRAAHGKCVACGSRHNLQFDHIRPVALGGTSIPDNLQLLCGSCNLRRGVKTYGAQVMRR